MRGTILIVDDSPESAALLAVAVESAGGIEWMLASDGEEALRWLDGPTGGSAAAVVTDLEMPRMNGYDLIAAIRSRTGLLGLPVIVLSGSTDPEAPRRSLAAGASAFLSKPFSPGQFRALLEELLHG